MAARNCWLTFALVSTRNADVVPPAAAMPLRLESDEPTPITNVATFGVAFQPAAAIASMLVRLVLHSDGSPSVANTTAVTSPVCVPAHAFAWLIAPCNAAEVGVPLVGEWAPIEVVRALATPGSAAISTAAVA